MRIAPLLARALALAVPAFLIGVADAAAQPGQPTNLRATIAGSTLTLSWNAPTTGSTPTGYRLEFRNANGTLVATLPTGPELTTSVAIPPGTQGTFTAVVIALAGPLSGSASMPAVITIGGGIPGRPGNVRVNIAGGQLTATWTAPSGGDAPAGYLLEFRDLPGVVVARVPTGPQTTFSITIPPDVVGTYTLAISAVSGAGQGLPSDPVQFILTPSTCTTAPPVPTNLRGSLVSGTVTIQWDPAPGATTYYLKAGTTPITQNLYSGFVGNITTISASVGSNFRAYIRVYSQNACGNSPDSPAIFVPGDSIDGRWAGSGFPVWTNPSTYLQTTRAGAGGAVVNNTLLVVAGNPSSGSTNTAELFDPATGLSTAIASSSVSRAYAAAVTVGTKVFAVGGAISGDCNRQTGVTESYDPATNMWSTLPPLPFARGGLALAAVGTLIYAIGGGCGGVNTTDRVDVFDTVASSWSERAVMPTRREGAAAVAIDGRIYVVGGLVRNGQEATYTNLLEVFDTASGTWDRTRPSMPTARDSAVAVARNGRLHVIGGRNAAGLLTVHEVYDPRTAIWTTEPPLRQARGHAVGGVIDGNIYVAGGHEYTSAPPTGSMERFWNRPMAFTIQASQVVRLTFDAAVISGNPVCNGGRSIGFTDEPSPVQNGRFTVGYSSPEGSVVWQVTGSIDSATTASGMLSLTITNRESGCSGTINAPWTATRQP